MACRLLAVVLFVVSLDAIVVTVNCVRLKRILGAQAELDQDLADVVLSQSAGTTQEATNEQQHNAKTAPVVADMRVATDVPTLQVQLLQQGVPKTATVHIQEDAAQEGTEQEQSMWEPSSSLLEESVASKQGPPDGAMAPVFELGRRTAAAQTELHERLGIINFSKHIKAWRWGAEQQQPDLTYANLSEPLLSARRQMPWDPMRRFGKDLTGAFGIRDHIKALGWGAEAQELGTEYLDFADYRQQLKQVENMGHCQALLPTRCKLYKFCCDLIMECCTDLVQSISRVWEYPELARIRGLSSAVAASSSASK